MKDWKKTLITPETSILNALQVIDSVALQIALVVDAELRLVGTVTDGDARRGILRGLDLNAPVSQVMNAAPKSAPFGSTAEQLETLVEKLKVKHLPLLDSVGRVQGVFVLGEPLTAPARPNAVVLMAGGLGSRLAPLTDNCPKPLLRVGDRPILEIILQNFINQGFNRFYISVNYLGQMIKDYFGDGSRWGAQIEYLEETQRLGTAGALSLLPERPQHPFLVMNGDLLTKANFGSLVHFHEEHGSAATMGVREYDVKVPYGVVQVENLEIRALVEKPTYTHYVNAGVYCLQPQTLDLIPPNNFFDMPTLFEKLLQNRQPIFSFPIREYWLDIGQLHDFKKANEEFANLF